VYKATRLVDDEKAVNCHRRHSEKEGEADIIGSVSAAEENIRNHYNLDTCKRATSRKNSSFYKKF
jgi:hypothetical protein